MPKTLSKTLEVGNYRKLPHYKVVGDSTKFYVWVNEDCEGNASRWLTGREAFEAYNKLTCLYSKNKKGFISFVKEIHKTY